MTPKKTLSILAIAALTLVGCGSTEAEEEPQSAEEQQAQDNLDASAKAYDETYPVVETHVINEYGITETAELCDAQHNLDPEHDQNIEQIMNDAGVEVEGTTREDPGYRGAYDATDDAIYDLCEDAN